MITTAAVEISGPVQALVDSRLDTIDRLLMGRMPRQDRLAIVREVEAQIFEQLQEREGEDLTREDVLAVLTRLDPPEAYLPEEAGDAISVSTRRSLGPRAVRPVRTGDPRLAKLSGILGLVVTALILLSPAEWMIGALFQSNTLIVTLWVGTIFLVFVGGILSVTLGIASRMGSAWAVAGILTGSFSLIIALIVGLLLLLELRG